MSGRGWLAQLSSGALALLLAVILWFVANEDIVPIEDQARFPSDGSIAVECRNVPEGYAVYDLSQRQIRVALRGLRSGIRALTAADVRAVADLADTPTTGVTHTVRVHALCDACRRRGVRIVRQDVVTITVALAPLERETRSVTVTFDDKVPERFWITASPATPPQVQLAGARVPLARVERVVAQIAALPDLSDENRIVGVTVLPLDRDGQTVADIAVEPPRVDVALEVRERGTELSVRPAVSGNEADGYYITGISVDPQFVQLEGAPPALADIQQKGTVDAPLDIAGATEDVVRRVPLSLPDGIAALNAPDGVTVTVRISPLHGSVAFAVPIQTRGLGAGLGLKAVSPRRVDVLVGGPQAKLGDLTADDVEVVVDLAGLGAGRHSVTPRPIVPSGYLWRSVSPSIVDVVIEAGARTPTVPARP